LRLDSAKEIVEGLVLPLHELGGIPLFGLLEEMKLHGHDEALMR